MDKNEVIMELQGYIDTLKNDNRNKIKGLKIVICDSNWTRKKKGECNFLIEWDNEIKRGKVKNGRNCSSCK